jgi:hypothetical protein
VVSGWDGVGEDDIGFAAELVEDLGEGEDGADGVTVGACVRGEQETGMGTEGRKECSDRVLVRRGLLEPGCLLKFVDLDLWSHD